MALEKKNYDPATMQGAVGDENQLPVTQGAIIIGDSAGLGTELSVKDSGKILVGNGTTATSVAVSGDTTLASTGATTVTDLTITSEARGDLLRRGASAWERVSAKTSGQILVGDGTDVVSVAVSGDATLSSAGAVTIANSAVTAAKMAATLDLSSKTVTLGNATVGALVTSANNGAVGTGVTAVENGDGRNHVTVLTLTDVAMGTITGGADQALGALIYTFPAGAHLHKVTYMSVGLTTAGSTKTDTPDVGIGSVIATGAVAILSGTGTFEDYLTGQTAADSNGTASVALLGATAGVLTGISLNKSGDVKAVHLNAADGWAAGAAGALTASGTVTLEWSDLA